MDQQRIAFDLQTNEPLVTAIPDGEVPAAWEEVAPGRVRPRRVRGSFVGRELG